MTSLINLLTTSEFSDSPVYAELVDSEFRPESQVSAVPAPGFALFGSVEEIVDAMRDGLWLDFDPRVNPEDEGFEMNYPGNLEAFDPEFLRQAALDVIQGKD